MFCEKCGQKVNDTASFCKGCGAKLSNRKGRTNDAENHSSPNQQAARMAKADKFSQSNDQSYEQIKEYLKMIFDMEMNIYIQETTIEKLYEKRQRLGIKEIFDHPRMDRAEPEPSGAYFTAGMVTGIISAVIITFSMCDSCSIFSVFPGAFFGALIGSAVGLIVYLFSYIKAKFDAKKEQEFYAIKYDTEMAKYNEKIKKDEERVKRENVKKSEILALIGSLEKKKKESEGVLDKMYSYNIISPKYQYNLAAISTFYEYFESKRTKSLGFNDMTGDQGAYNLYENELRLGRIIGNTEIIIQRLDEVIENQHRLVDALSEAGRKIDYLSNSVNSMHSTMKSIDAGIKENNAIVKYNGERTNAELKYMNDLNTMKFIQNSRY